MRVAEDVDMVWRRSDALRHDCEQSRTFGHESVPAVGVLRTCVPTAVLRPCVTPAHADLRPESLTCADGAGLPDILVRHGSVRQWLKLERFAGGQDMDASGVVDPAGQRVGVGVERWEVGGVDASPVVQQ